MLLFAYLGPLALVSLVASRREFVKWHAKQGLVFTVAVFLAFVVVRSIRSLVDRFLWAVFAEAFRAAVAVTLVGVLVLVLVCIVRALDGERFRIPLLADLADRL